jgi:lysophospholipase L1-like esterase
MTDLGTPARYHVNALGDRFVETDGHIPRTLMPDSLHLSPLGYRIWAEAIVPAIR